MFTIAEARAHAGYTQAQMAEKLGVTRRTYMAWETGKREMKTEAFVRFCRIIGISVDDIFYSKS